MYPEPPVRQVIKFRVHLVVPGPGFSPRNFHDLGPRGDRLCGLAGSDLEAGGVGVCGLLRLVPELDALATDFDFLEPSAAQASM